MKVLLVGGGSGGPVAPLLAVAKEIKSKDQSAEFLLVGTKNGPEQKMAQDAVIDFTFITGAKLRRYFSFQNFLIPFQLIKAFFESLKIINQFKPDCVFGAGSFIQVPVCFAAWIKRVPVVLHQQDIVPGLANKLSQHFANKITVTFEYSLRSFYSSFGFFYNKKEQDKLVLTGNPFRGQLKNGNREKALKEFGLKGELPTLLVLGGATGAQYLNRLIWDSLPALSKSVQIIHATGKGKNNNELNFENYKQYEFISNMADAYALADIVLARAGISTITELSNLKKVSIIVPMPQTHQEANAAYLKARHAAVTISQNNISLTSFVNFIRKLIFANDVQEMLKENIHRLMKHDASEKIASIIMSYKK